MDVTRKVLLRALILFPALAVMLVAPSGSWTFWPGWVVFFLFAIGTVVFTLYLGRRDPELLRRRMQSHESTREQRLFRVMWIPLWVVLFTLPGIDYRLGWTHSLTGGLPIWLIALADVLFVASFLLIFQTMRANTFASSTIQVEAGQYLISSGPYEVVRHPMYSGFLIMILVMPLALGSAIDLTAAVLLIPVVVYRLVHEERTLRAELPGYTEYCVRTRYRLIPHVY